MGESNMDKKPLIGVSICAVVLLLLGSLTNVVGYQSVQSATVNNSPLFATRAQRETNQQQNIITSQYLGMGKETHLQFPMRDNQTESLKRAIEYISKMDDETFERFTELVIQQSKQNDSLRDINPNEIKQILNQLRTTSITLLNSPMYKNNYQLNSTPMIPTINWFPGCFLVIFFVFLMAIFQEILHFIYYLIFPE
jgi:hypothetical protein